MAWKRQYHGVTTSYFASASCQVEMKKWAQEELKRRFGDNIGTTIQLQPVQPLKSLVLLNSKQFDNQVSKGSCAFLKLPPCAVPWYCGTGIYPFLLKLRVGGSQGVAWRFRWKVLAAWRGVSIVSNVFRHVDGGQNIQKFWDVLGDLLQLLQFLPRYWLQLARLASWILVYLDDQDNLLIFMDMFNRNSQFQPEVLWTNYCKCHLLLPKIVKNPTSRDQTNQAARPTRWMRWQPRQHTQFPPVGVLKLVQSRKPDKNKELKLLKSLKSR